MGRSGSVRAGAGGFAGTLYDGGWVVQQLHDKVFTVCAAQAGAPLPLFIFVIVAHIFN